MVEREVVTGPRRPRRRARRPATSDIDEQTRLGDVYLRGLMRTQLRLGLAVSLSTLGLLAALPVVFALAPGTATPTIAGIPEIGRASGRERRRNGVSAESLRKHYY